MKRTTFERVYVAKFCERCGKEEFEGVVFGQWRTRHLQAESGTRRIMCDRCRAEPRALEMLSFQAVVHEPGTIPTEWLELGK